ncbi:hypothetical protein OF83DRAFT_1101041 [Amylostereum chailletii]|nr:hypothetical protein OF83DRAFT_1101041 [Amylostereum chailletii]
MRPSSPSLRADELWGCPSPVAWHRKISTKSDLLSPSPGGVLSHFLRLPAPLFAQASRSRIGEPGRTLAIADSWTDTTSDPTYNPQAPIVRQRSMQLHAMSSRRSTGTHGPPARRARVLFQELPVPNV